MTLENDENKPALLHVFDLPQIYEKPPPSTLIDILNALQSVPRSWSRPGPFTNDDNKQHRVDESDSAAITNYLTSIVASPLAWIEDDLQREMIWELASARLSERSGRTGMPSMDRNFELVVRDQPVSITLHEPSLTADNLGLKTWAASYALAQRLWKVELPKAISGDVLNVLELGAGTGLVGIAAAIVFRCNVCLTDLPEIEPNLSRNIFANQSLVQSFGGSIVSGVLDWSNSEILTLSSKQQSIVIPQSPHSYPLIVAADSVYSEEHPAMLARTIQFWLAPGTNSRVLLELPFRAGYANEMQLVRKVMGEVGFKLTDEDEDMGYDDWGSNTLDGQSQVRCWFSVWAWK